VLRRRAENEVRQGATFWANVLPVLVVVVAAGTDASSVEVRALASTASGVLAPTDRVEIVPGAAEHAEAEAIGATRRADAIVVVRWVDAAREHAVLEVQAARGTWVARSMDFAREDAPEERGRALGFALASMLPQPQPQPQERPAEPTRPQPDAPGDAAPAPYRAIFDATLSAEVGLGGEGATGLGGRLGGGVRLVSPLWARAGLAYRAGPMGDANATVASFDAGLAVYAFEPGRRRFALGARLDVAAIRHAVALPGGTASGDRWVGAFDLLAEGSVGLARHVALALALGPELALGQVHVIVDGVQVATIPTWRLRAEIGLQFAF
jgi:hypothetical protein